MSKVDIAQVNYLALKFYPPLIRDDLLKTTSFGLDSKLLVASWISFGSEDLSFHRDHIFSNFREIYNGGGNREVTDKSGRKWNIGLGDASGLPAIVFETESTKFQIFDCFGLHPNVEVRASSLQLVARQAAMAPTKYDLWRTKILARALEDDEVTSLLKELSESPFQIKRRIIDEIEGGSATFSTLVPNFESYYVDLACDPGGCGDIFEFSESALRMRIAGSLALEGVGGLKRLLSLSAHSAVTAELAKPGIELPDLEKIIEWAAKYGDVVSIVGAVELGLAAATKESKISESIIELIEKFRKDDLSKSGALSKFCSLAILIGGELSRNAMFATALPYWRRLAIFSHAAVLQQAVISTNSDIEHLSESGSEGRAPYFLIQSAVDLRREPRWQAGYCDPIHLKAEFLGRIYHAALMLSATLPAVLRTYILDDPKFKGEISFPLAYLPGPLEGGVQPIVELPDDLAAAIETGLSAIPLELSSFIPLVNSALVFRLDGAQIELATKAIKAANYQLRTAARKDDLEPILAGIANVSAITRSGALGDDVFILIRVLRNRSDRSISVDQALWIGLVAAASRSDEREWIEFVGRLFTEISFQEITQPEAESVYFVLRHLCRIVPELWRSCAKACAALEAVLPYDGP